MPDRVTIFACERCSRHTGCPCPQTTSEYTDRAACVEARHREAVKRARRLPVASTIGEATELAVAAQRRQERQQRRPSQRARPVNGASLDDTIVAVIRAAAS